MLGDANEAVLAVLAAIEAHVHTSLKPPSFWAHFHTVAHTLLQALIAPPAATEEDAQQGPASSGGGRSTQNGAAVEPQQRSTQEELRHVISARAPRRSSTADIESNGKHTASSVEWANGTDSSGAVPGLVTDLTQPGAVPVPKASSSGAKPAPAQAQDGGMRAELRPATLLQVARFWLMLTLRSARFPPRPLTLPHDDAWRVPSCVSVIVPQGLMWQAVKELKTLLQWQSGALLLDIVALPEFKAALNELLFHPQSFARIRASDLLSGCVLPGPPEARHALLQVC